jgi:hypothetical protein
MPEQVINKAKNYYDAICMLADALAALPVTDAQELLHCIEDEVYTIVQNRHPDFWEKIEQQEPMFDTHSPYSESALSVNARR